MEFAPITAYRLRRVAESILGMAEKLFDVHLGIRALDWRVLVKLAHTPGSISTDIGRDMLMTPVQTGRSLSKLRDLDLVIAMPAPDDGRATRYTLTRSGHDTFEAGLKIVFEVQAYALRDLNAVEQVALESLLGRLVASSNYGPEDIERLSAALFDGRHKRA
ncbi:MarR family winged helix-turn-helix transcriptional regulator [Achromobacter pestifer]